MFRKLLVTHLWVFITAVGLMGASPAFGIWPFSSEEEGIHININTADQATLAALPELGEAKAEAIVEYRHKNGPFEAIEDVKKVPGIDEQVFASIKTKITVKEEEQSSRKEFPAQGQTDMPKGRDQG